MKNGILAISFICILLATYPVLSGCAGCAEDAKLRDEAFTKRYPNEKKEGESLEEFKKRMHDKWWHEVITHYKEKVFDPFIEEQSKFGEDRGGMDDYDPEDMSEQDEYIDKILGGDDSGSGDQPEGTGADRDAGGGTSDQTDIDQSAGGQADTDQGAGDAPRTGIREKTDKMKPMSAQTLRGGIRDRASSIMKKPSHKPKCQE